MAADRLGCLAQLGLMPEPAPASIAPRLGIGCPVL
jgi:hypothetical protein